VKRLSILILIFAVALTFFIIAPGLLNKPFTPYPHLKIADVLNLFTPLVLIPLYFLLLYFGASQIPSLKSMIVFLIFPTLWVEGQGIHLTVNSIGFPISPEIRFTRSPISTIKSSAITFGTLESSPYPVN
jgi:hypothetical protein